VVGLRELVVQAVDAVAASPDWRDRVQLARRFAEDVATLLAELDEHGIKLRRSRK
jgi:hypothetical protein